MGMETLVGLAIAGAIGGHLSRAHAANKKRKDEALNAKLDAIRSGGTGDTAVSSNTSDTARQMLVSGGSQKLIASAGLSGDTTGGGGSIRRRLLGG